MCCRLPEPNRRTSHLPATPSAQRRLALLVESRIDFAALATSIRATMRTLDLGLLAHVQPLEANLDFWRRRSRAIAILSGSLSLLALGLASIGVATVSCPTW